MRFGEAPKIETPKEKPQLDELREQEDTIMNSFRGKARSFAKVFALLTTLSFASPALVEAGELDVKEKPNTEQQAEQSKQRVFDLLKQLQEIKVSMDEEFNRTQARDLVYFFAADLKGDDGKLTTVELKAAIDTVMTHLPEYVDQHFDSSPDGTANPEDITGFREALKTSVGLQEFYQMWEQYK
ncbi:MAG: hypothetical protein WCV71_02185 [Patescibacteria group bacterium]|jgi:hypothetical protein